MKRLSTCHQKTNKTKTDNNVVYVHGVFDLFHYGHLNFLKQAKSLGDILVVGLVTDENATEIKVKPIMSYIERWLTLLKLGYIDLIVKQDNADPTETLKKLEGGKYFPDILVRASDVKEPVPGQEYIESKGGKVVIVDYTKGISSSIIKERIRNGR